MALAHVVTRRHLLAMKKRNRRSTLPAPMLLAELTLASWETVMRRTALIATGACSPAEYRRMVSEKIAASRSSGLALLYAGLRPGADAAARFLAPWHRRAAANARRLRRR